MAAAFNKAALMYEAAALYVVAHSEEAALCIGDACKEVGYEFDAGHNRGGQSGKLTRA